MYTHANTPREKAIPALAQVQPSSKRSTQRYLWPDMYYMYGSHIHVMITWKFHASSTWVVYISAHCLGDVVLQIDLLSIVLMLSSKWFQKLETQKPKPFFPVTFLLLFVFICFVLVRIVVRVCSLST